MTVQPMFNDTFVVQNNDGLSSSGRTKLAVPLQSQTGGFVRITIDLLNGGAKFKVDLVETMESENPVVSLISGSADRLADVPLKLDEHVRRLSELQYRRGESVLDYFCRDLDRDRYAELKALLQNSNDLLVEGGAQYACH